MRQHQQADQQEVLRLEDMHRAFPDTAADDLGRLVLMLVPFEASQQYGESRRYQQENDRQYHDSTGTNVSNPVCC